MLETERALWWHLGVVRPARRLRCLRRIQLRRIHYVPVKQKSARDLEKDSRARPRWAKRWAVASGSSQRDLEMD